MPYNDKCEREKNKSTSGITDDPKMKGFKTS